VKPLGEGRQWPCWIKGPADEPKLNKEDNENMNGILLSGLRSWTWSPKKARMLVAEHTIFYYPPCALKFCDVPIWFTIPHCLGAHSHLCPIFLVRMNEGFSAGAPKGGMQVTWWPYTANPATK
jgi:hypothetical protein